MGGDRAPREIVQGTVDAVRADADLVSVLVGRRSVVEGELATCDGVSLDRISVVHAEEVIAMSDSPVDALRKKRDSSIEVATKLVKDGRAQAVVSAGNTGACVAAAQLRLGLLPQVKRPGIAVAMPAGDRPVVVIDAGANINPKPTHLIQYGVMASLYATAVLNVKNPRVGLLNVGEESEKGTSLAKVVHNEFGETDLNYIGNIEGSDVFSGGCDVVVCDGFVGNVLLKASEGLAARMLKTFHEVLAAGGGTNESKESSATPSIAAALAGVFSQLRERFDYAEYGGAPLLGVSGVTTIAHGRSDARAIANAVRVAKSMVGADFNGRVTTAIEQMCLAKRN